MYVCIYILIYVFIYVYICNYLYKHIYVYIYTFMSFALGSFPHSGHVLIILIYVSVKWF